ncbi:MAG TPA: hypothetical protein VH817_07685 [Thermoleophilaceae bacterium]|jgi:hypothetical protein
MTSFGRGWVDDVLRLALCALALVFVFGVSSAHATISPSDSFGSSGSGDGELSGPTGIAVDQSNGDVYVADTGNHRVVKYDSDGNFILTFGWGVDDGTATIQTCTSGCEAGISGNGAGQFADPKGISVDNSGGASDGDVYVSDSTNHIVQKFESDGSYVATIDGSASPNGAFSGPVGISVDQDGNLWTADSTNNIDEFDPLGVYVMDSEFSDTYGSTLAIAVNSTTDALYLIRGSGATERWTRAGGDETAVDNSSRNFLAVDPSNGDMYTASSSSVAAYNSSNTQIDPSNLTGVTSPAGIAFGSDAGDLYVTDSSTSDVTIFSPPSPGPPVIDGESSSDVSPVGAKVHAQVNPFGNDTTCHFEYVDDTEFQANGYTNATSADCSPHDIGSGFADQSVSATLTGLSPSTTYHYRVVANNTDGTTNGDDETFTTGPVPSVDSTSVVNITASTARLKAQINPAGSPTSYQFQYGTDTNYTGGTVPADPEPLGSFNTDQPASQDISGLQPNTTYHYRVLLDGSIPDTDHTFTTRAGVGGSTAGGNGLPDNRGYEEVTPPEKNGAIALGGIPSTDGNSAEYYSLGSLPGNQSSTQANVLRATRTATGWTSTDLTPPPNLNPAPALLTQGPMFSTPDLGTTIFSTVLSYNAGDNDPDDLRGYPNGHSDLYKSTGIGNMDFLSTGPEAGAGTGPFEATFDWASADASHVVFSTGEALTDAAAATPIQPDSTGSYGQYLYDRTGGQTHTVNVDDAGDLLNPYGAVLGHGWFISGNGLSPNIYAVTTNAISTDGSKIFFESPPPTPYGTQQFISHLWVRTNNATTVQIDSPSATDPADSATYEGAASDGSKVFFTTTQQLTGDDTDTAKDLYEYNTNTQVTTRLSGGASDPAGSGLDGVVAISNDGSHVWFIAESALASGASDGSHNLYVYDTVADTINYIAPVSDTDADPLSVNGPSLVNQADFSRPAIPTANGSVLVFTSNADLTGDNSSGFSEVYRYVTATKTLTCVSCVNGVTHRGNADLGGTVGGSYRPPGQSTAITSDGSKVFFDTPDALVPGDVNAATAPTVNRSIDVYEWSAGTVSLISSGHGTRASGLSGVTPNGSDVLFQTTESLVPQDTDGGAVDVYDARVGGGFPAPAGPIPPCDDSSCHQGSGLTPFFPTPLSQTFIGPGNVQQKLRKLPKVTVSSITAKQRRKLASTGKITLTLHVSAAGRVTGKITGKLTKHGKTRTLASASKRVKKAGTVHLTLTLSGNALDALKARGSLPLTISVGMSGQKSKQTAHLRLKASRAKAATRKGA